VPEIGLFPLPLVLVPTERIPLHIFEPRYKELVEECLATGEPFGLVLAAGDGAVHEIGTKASIEEVLDVLDQGALNIVVEGRERFRLLELTSGRSFATCKIEPVEDDDDPPSSDESARAYELFRKLAEATEADIDLPDPLVPQLDFELAARVDFSTDAKQELITATSPRLRILRLAELLEAALETTQLQQTLRERAGHNGKVSPLDPDQSEP
jgi:ATP-dependent Lon protease